MPWSSPRSSGWRATAWIIEPKMLPMPIPAPSAPRPMPSASAIALPASATSPVVSARTKNADSMVRGASLVLGLDRRADVDGGQCGEDVRLDGHDDDDLEEVEDGRERDRERGDPRGDEEDQADESQDQHVSGEHVRVEPDAEGDEAHELAEDLERDDQRVEPLGDVGDPALQVRPQPVLADSLHVGEDPGH